MFSVLNQVIRITYINYAIADFQADIKYPNEVIELRLVLEKLFSPKLIS